MVRRNRERQSRPPAPDATVVARARLKLERHARIWSERPLTRAIYRDYHELVDAARSRVKGHDVEVGAGHGSFAEFRPSTIACDVVPCPWLDCAADAAGLPFADESLANVIMIDVLHHLSAPRAFFAGASEALAPGGRIIFIEPYVSPVSWLAWRFFHEEGIDTSADPLATEQAASAFTAYDPWDANIAIPTLLFWRHLKRFRELFPEFQVLRRERFDMLVMPLSGGFERRRWIPRVLVPAARVVERGLAPLAAFLAFRCLIVIEKTCQV